MLSWIEYDDEAAYVEQAKAKARALLDDVGHIWRATEMVAEALHEKRTLDAEELLTIWKDAIKGRSD
jgi:hypothetical protein